MNKRIIAGIALGGAALFAVPAGVAYAVSASNDRAPGVFTAFGTHTMQGRGSYGTNAGVPAPRSDLQPGVGMGGDRGGMQSGGNQGGRNQGGGNQGAWNQGQGYQGAGGGVHMPGMEGDPAALVVPGSTLTADETANLTFMVEEEKLAHDLYVEFGDAWNLRVFDNIAGAETQHEDEVKVSP